MCLDVAGSDVECSMFHLPFSKASPPSPTSSQRRKAVCLSL
jgi:hypothetical protein